MNAETRWIKKGAWWLFSLGIVSSLILLNGRMLYRGVVEATERFAEWKAFQKNIQADVLSSSYEEFSRQVAYARFSRIVKFSRLIANVTSTNSCCLVDKNGTAFISEVGSTDVYVVQRNCNLTIAHTFLGDLIYLSLEEKSISLPVLPEGSWLEIHDFDASTIATVNKLRSVELQFQSIEQPKAQGHLPLRMEVQEPPEEASALLTLMLLNQHQLFTFATDCFETALILLSALLFGIFGSVIICQIAIEEMRLRDLPKNILRWWRWLFKRKADFSAVFANEIIAANQNFFMVAFSPSLHLNRYCLRTKGRQWLLRKHVHCPNILPIGTNIVCPI